MRNVMVGFAFALLSGSGVFSQVSDKVLPQPVELPATVQSGGLLKKVDPIYPPLAREARIQGTVTLQAHIDEEGSIESLQVFSGHPMLVPAAIEAVKQWKYKPYVVNGLPV